MPQDIDLDISDPIIKEYIEKKGKIINKRLNRHKT